jgi:GH15 family glucan-1,4-alpha-glucosidase
MQRFTYSRLMNWVAFQRAADLAGRRGLPAPLSAWRHSQAADRAYLQIQEHDWNAERGAYVQYPHATTLDAGALMIRTPDSSRPWNASRRSW